MWLNFSILKKCFNDEKIDLQLVKGKNLSVQHLKCFFNENNILDDFLYFVPEYVSSEILSSKGNYIISSKHKDLKNILAKVDKLLVATEEPEMIFNLIENIFNYYIKWEQCFIKEVLNNKTLPLLIERCEEILKNPISITDCSFRVLASSNIEVDMDEEWEYIKKNGYHSSEFVERFLKDEEFQRCMQNSLVFPYFVKRNYLRYESVICPIVTNGKLMAFVSMIALNGDFNDALISLLVEISKLMSNIFIHEEALITPNILENNTVKGFLLKENDGKSCKEIVEKQLGYNKKNNLFIAILQSDEKYASNFMLLSRIVDEFSRKDRFKYCYILKIDHSIAIICNMTRNKIPRNFVFQLKDDFLKFNNIKIAVSLCGDRFDMLPYLYEQAVAAMTYGNIVDCKQRVLFYEKYFYFHVIDEVIDVKKIEAIIHPAFKLLKEKNQSDELIHTLEVYLLNYFDVEKTAEALHVHRNSVYYRIKKIESLCDIDLTNEIEKSHLLFSVGFWKKYNDLL